MPYSCSNYAGPPAYPGSYYPLSTNFFQNNYDYWTGNANKCFNDASASLGSIVSTIQTARDVFAISQAVGYGNDKLIRYWGELAQPRHRTFKTNTIPGFSYGTLLGNVIARLYPSWIDRMILDGNIDPNSYYFEP